MFLSTMRSLIILSVLVIISEVTIAAPQYAWDFVEFSGDSASVKEKVFMAGIAYDTKSKFMCAGFPALAYGGEVTIGCFDTKKYSKGSKPVFKAFPTLADNGLPVSLLLTLRHNANLITDLFIYRCISGAPVQKWTLREIQRLPDHLHSRSISSHPRRKTTPVLHQYPIWDH